MRRWLTAARIIIQAVSPAQMPSMPSAGTREHEQTDGQHGDQVAERHYAEEAVVGGADQHPVVGEGDRPGQHDQRQPDQ